MEAIEAVRLFRAHNVEPLIEAGWKFHNEIDRPDIWELIPPPGITVDKKLIIKVKYWDIWYAVGGGPSTKSRKVNKNREWHAK